MADDGLIVGVDLGLKGGISRLRHDGEIHDFQTWDERSKRAGEMEVCRYQRVAATLHRVIADGTGGFYADHVFYESVARHAGTLAAHAYGALRIKLLEICEAHGIEPEGVGVGEIKKHATKRGDASKELMIASAKRHWGLTNVLEDGADALWIAETGRVTRLKELDQ